MLKELIASLGNEGIKSNSLIKQGFGYLIRNTTVYCLYSVKYEMSKEDFHDWFAEQYDYEFFGSYQKKYEFIGIVDRWYEFFLEHGTLIDKTKSLKSDCKKWYRENKDKELKGFDRFFETVIRIFEEANSTYDVVFYSYNAIMKNKQFSDDRKSCFLNDRKDYLKVLSHLNSYYVMIYRSGKPISRLWAVLSKDKKSITIFNNYGFPFKDLSILFSASKDEFDTITYSDIENSIGVYVNREDWLISKNSNLNDFIYQVNCPSCGNHTYTKDLLMTKDYKIICNSCMYSKTS
jgi:hypothetical protein